MSPVAILKFSYRLIVQCHLSNIRNVISVIVVLVSHVACRFEGKDMSPSRIWGLGAPLENQRNMNAIELISLSFIVVMIADNISPSFLGHSHLQNELHEVARLGFTHFFYG